MRNPLAGLYEAVLVGDDVASRFMPSAEVGTPLRGEQGAVDWILDESGRLLSHGVSLVARS